MFKLEIEIYSVLDKHNPNNVFEIPILYEIIRFYQSKYYDLVLNRYVKKYEKIIEKIIENIKTNKDYAIIKINNGTSKPVFNRRLSYDEIIDYKNNIEIEKNNKRLSTECKLTKTEIINKIVELSKSKKVESKDLNRLFNLSKLELVKILNSLMNSKDNISNYNRKNFIRKIANHFGLDNQMNKAIEELNELIIAIENDDLENIKEEIADVKIMIIQIMYLLDIKDSDVDKIMNFKVQRTLNRYPGVLDK